jgi:hypothetical protein
MKNMKFKKYITAPAPTLLALFRDNWDTKDTNTNLQYCGISGRSHVWQSRVNPSLTYRWTPLTGWVRAIVDHCVMGDPTGKPMGQVLNPRVPKATLAQRRKEHGVPFEVLRIRVRKIADAKHLIAKRHARDIQMGRTVVSMAKLSA